MNRLLATRSPEPELRAPWQPRRLLLAFTLLLAFLPTAHAADLAPGLSYLRSADPTAIVKALESGSVVLDLRTVTDEIPPLRIPRTRVLLVLVSPATPALTLPGAITLGRATPGLNPDLTVTTTVESDTNATAALASGTAPETLILENANKPRFDESLLVREHHTGVETAAPTVPAIAAAPSESSGTTPSTASPAPPVIIDAVLQRAVHVYRGLLALKKIPAP